MPRDLFGNVTRQSISIGNRKWYALPLSLFSHSAIVGLLIALPILAPAIMPSVFADGEPTWISTSLPAPPPPPIRQEKVVAPPSDRPIVPTQAATGFAPERPRIETGWEEANGSLNRIIGDFDKDAVFGPPPPVVEKAPPPPVRVGFGVRAPQKLREVNPVYPPIAQSARVQGIVIIEATIGAEGRVTNARILRSVPLLDQAAIDAVKQWEFTPTLLNGVPVPVVMTVTVNFTLK